MTTWALPDLTGEIGALIGGLLGLLLLLVVVLMGLRSRAAAPTVPPVVIKPPAAHRPRPAGTGPSMYEQLGVSRIRAAVEQFYRRVLTDPAVADYFVDLSDADLVRLKRHQAQVISQILGGPVRYDLAALAEAHRHLHVTNDAYARVVSHLLAVLYHLNVSSDAIKTLSGALEDVRSMIVNETVHVEPRTVPIDGSGR